VLGSKACGTLQCAIFARRIVSGGRPAAASCGHLVSLGGVPPEIAVAMATGNNARVYRLNSGVLAPDRDADLVLVDACSGGSQNDALSALKNGDIMGVGAVITNGVPRLVGRSRNTPETMRRAKIAHCRIPQGFAAEH
jgi:enamidase